MSRKIALLTASLLALILLAALLALPTIAQEGQPSAETTVEAPFEKKEQGDLPECSDCYGILRAGGPDDFGYAFKDSTEAGGPIYSWVEITGTNNITFSDETFHGPFPIGFTFNFYGNDYTQFYVTSNGMVTFDGGGGTDSTNDCPLPSSDGNEDFIAGIWDDLDQDAGTPDGTGWYQSYGAGSCPYSGYAGACLVMEWDGMYHWLSSADDLTFEIILFDDNDILIQSQDASDEAGSGATTGIENADASDGLTYACNTANSISDTLAIQFYYPIPAPRYALPYNQKDAPYKVEEGHAFDYVLVISNTGRLTGTTTFVSDTLPAEVSQAGVTTYTALGSDVVVTGFGCTSPITWLGSIPAGQGLLITIPVTAESPAGTLINNTAVVTDPGIAAEVELTAWTHVYAAGELYYYEDFNSSAGGWTGDSQWEWGLPTGPSPNPHSWSKVWATVLDGNYENTGSTSALTRTIDLTGMPPTYTARLQWWHYLELYSSSDDADVYINGINVFDSDADGTSTGGAWVEEWRDITPYAGQIITVEFRFYASAYSNDLGWYVDDVAVHIFEPAPEFAGSWKDVDRSTVATGDRLTYTIYITNSGNLTSADGHMHDQLPDGLAVADVSLTGGGVIGHGADYFFWRTMGGSAAWLLGPGEDATITVVATATEELACGLSFTNTTLITDSLAREDMPIAAPPVVAWPGVYYEADFEADAGGLITQAYDLSWNPTTGSEWEWGAPTNNDDGAHSGLNAWSTDLDGYYDDTLIDTLRTPALDLPGHTGLPLTLEFWDWRNHYANLEWARVVVSATSVPTWTVVWEEYKDQRYWGLQRIDLIGLVQAGDQIQFRWQWEGNDDGLETHGWDIDDVSIHAGCPTIHVGPDHSSAVCQGSSVDYVLTVVNANDVADTINIALTTSAWPTSVSADTLALGPGETASVTVTVDVPGSAALGDTDTVTITATAQTSGLSAKAQVESTVSIATGWEDLAPSPHGVNYPAVVYENDSLYQIGGESEGSIAHNGDYRYDLATDTWVKMTNMITGVYRMDGAAINGHIYVPGGASQDETFNDFVQVYSTADDSWSTVAPMPAALSYHEVVALDGMLYVLGGQTTDDVYTSTVHIYDPAADGWTTGTPMTIPVAHAASGVIGGKIYLTGGYYDDGADHYVETLQIYDPATDSWSYGASLPAARVNAADGVVHDRYLVLAGGHHDDLRSSSNVALFYDAVQDAWFSLPSANSWRYAGAGDSDGYEFYYVAGTEKDGPSVFRSTRNEHLLQCPGFCVQVADVDLALVTTGTIYTDVPVSFSADIMPYNADKPYTYSIDYGAGPSTPATSSNDPLTALDHTFTTAGAHAVEIAVWNCDMTEAQAVTDSVQFTVHEPGVCVDLTGITITGDTSGMPGMYTFTTSYEPVDASSPIVYLWDNGDTTVTSVRYLGVGIHTLVVRATNCTDALVTGTHTIVIPPPNRAGLVVRHGDDTVITRCVQFTENQITGLELLDRSGLSYTAVGGFVSEIDGETPSDPYFWSYWLSDAGDGNWTFASVTPDSRYVHNGYVDGWSVADWNNWPPLEVPPAITFDQICGAAITCTQITDVDLGLLTAGAIYTDTVVQFSADVAPDDAYKPYTYTINYDDGTAPVTGNSSSDPLVMALEHTFATTGAHTVEIAVWNCGMTAPVTDTVEVMVLEHGECVEVTDVDLTLVTAGNIYTSTSVQFGAGIAPGNFTPPYTYTVNYGDETAPAAGASSDNPLVLSHTFINTGTYTVAISVWNCEMTAPVTDTVEMVVTTLGYKVYLPIVMRSF